MRLQSQDGKDLSPQEMFKVSRVVFKIGLGIIGFALLLWAWNLSYVLTMDTTEGIVVGGESYEPNSYQSRPSTGARLVIRLSTHKPMFRFTDKDGNDHEASVRFAASNYNFTVGEKITIAYPDDYSYVVITDWWKNSRVPLIVLAIAAVVFLASFSIRKTGKKLEAEGQS